MDNDRLSPKQTAFVTALFSYPTIKAAAAACGIAQKTATRWLDSPQVQAAIERQQIELTAQVTRGLANLSLGAVATLADTMSADQPGAVRVRAADVVLGRALQLRELTDIEQRLQKLEAQNE